MTSKIKELCGKATRFLLAIFGVFPASNPTAGVTDLRFSSKSIYTVLCVLYGIVPIALLFDMVFSNTAQVAIGSSRLSHKLMLYSLIPFNGGPNLIIRLTNLVQCQQIIDLFKEGCEIRDMLISAGLIPKRLSKGKKIILCAYAGYCALFCTKLVLLSIPAYAHTRYRDLNFTLLPNSKMIRTIVLLLVNVGLNALLISCVTFVVVGGVYLLQIQDGLYRLLEAQLGSTAATHNIVDLQFNEAKSIAYLHRTVAFHDYVKFAPTFRSVKSIFESYQSIAGWHLLCLAFLGTVGIIRGFSTMMIDPDTRVGNAMLAFEGVAIIVLLSCFGDYFKQSILSNQRKIEDLTGLEQNGNVKWYLSWKMELTAREFFTVHHTLILHVVGTVITFFIFMFQLKLTEDAGTVDDAPSCNCITAA